MIIYEDLPRCVRVPAQVCWRTCPGVLAYLTRCVGVPDQVCLTRCVSVPDQVC